MSIHPSIHPSIHQSVWPSIRQQNHLPLCCTQAIAATVSILRMPIVHEGSLCTAMFFPPCDLWPWSYDLDLEILWHLLHPGYSKLQCSLATKGTCALVWFLHPMTFDLEAVTLTLKILCHLLCRGYLRYGVQIWYAHYPWGVGVHWHIYWPLWPLKLWTWCLNFCGTYSCLLYSRFTHHIHYATYPWCIGVSWHVSGTRTTLAMELWP